MHAKRFAVLGLLTCAFSTIGPVSAQQAGDTIVFALPAGTDITTGPEGDKVIYVGRPVGYVDPTGCTGDAEVRPMQQVMLVDAGSGTRATRSQAMLTISINGSPYFDVVKNGTRIGNVTLEYPCSIHGEAYQRYRGIIE